jgi:hypothetical protein
VSQNAVTWTCDWLDWFSPIIIINFNISHLQASTGARASSSFLFICGVFSRGCLLPLIQLGLEREHHLCHRIGSERTYYHHRHRGISRTNFSIRVKQTVRHGSFKANSHTTPALILWSLCTRACSIVYGQMSAYYQTEKYHLYPVALRPLVSFTLLKGWIMSKATVCTYIGDCTSEYNNT